MQFCSNNNSTSPKNIVIIDNISFLAILAHPVCYYNRSAVVARRVQRKFADASYKWRALSNNTPSHA